MTKAQTTYEINKLKNELENTKVKMSVAKLRGIPQDQISSDIKSLKSKITKIENLLEKME